MTTTLRKICAIVDFHGKQGLTLTTRIIVALFRSIRACYVINQQDLMIPRQFVALFPED